MQKRHCGDMGKRTRAKGGKNMPDRITELEYQLDEAKKAIKSYMQDNEKLYRENERLKQQLVEITAAALAVHKATVELNAAVNL